jgi:RNA polymerase sigma-70 factor (ECF subfamily)
MELDEMYAQFQPRLRVFARSLTRDSERAEDLVQATFERALVNRSLLDMLSVPQCRSWLYSTLKNLHIDEYRSNQRRSAMLHRLAAVTNTVIDPPELADTERLMKDLPEADRTLLNMRYERDMNSTEIGTALGIPSATVRTRLRVILQRIRDRNFPA